MTQSNFAVTGSSITGHFLVPAIAYGLWGEFRLCWQFEEAAGGYLTLVEGSKIMDI